MHCQCVQILLGKYINFLYNLMQKLGPIFTLYVNYVLNYECFSNFSIAENISLSGITLVLMGYYHLNKRIVYGVVRVMLGYKLTTWLISATEFSWN